MLRAITKIVTLYLGLPKDIYVVALAEFVLALGRFVFPFLSLLLTQKLGLSAMQAGVWVTVVALSSLPGSFVGGKLSDHFSRKLIIIIGQACAVVTMVVCGFFATSFAILPLVFIAGFAMGVAMPAVRALIVDLSTPENRDAAMSLSYLAFNMGFAIGPLLAGFLFAHHTHWLFWLDGFATFVSMLLIICCLSGRYVIEAKSELEQAVTGSVWSVLWQRPHLILYTIICTLLSLAIAQFFFAIPLYLADVFKGHGAEHYGQVMTINAAVVVIFTPIFTALTRRYSALVGTIIAAAFFMLVLQHVALEPEFDGDISGRFFYDGGGDFDCNKKQCFYCQSLTE
ncbi:MFS transporter [Piscirickettsia litoralis]|uniref:MFS transporter n=1 Tax=Piscirickettsia litoralis TaxID=1891921 RepID=UPI001F471C91|nr:MFS transporter [Piscirickettsia litoralis]